MKVLSVDQIRKADAFTIEKEPISSLDLMERAASRCVDWMIKHSDSIQLKKSRIIQVVCGIGNNGGDGLVIARKLHEKGYKVEAILLRFAKNGSKDFEENLKRLNKLKVSLKEITEEDNKIEFVKEGILVDAIFGSGLSRPVKGWLANCIEQINQSLSFVISIDMPSGLFADTAIMEEGAIVSADVTLTFEAPKLSFLLPSTGRFAGDFDLLDIGLDKKFLAQQSVKNHFVSKEEVGVYLKKREKFSHKGTNGHALIIGGSKGKIGALILSSMACLRAGAGLVTAFAPACGLIPLQSSVPEVMVLTDSNEEMISSVPEISAYNSIAIGPGIGTDNQTANSLKLLIQNTKVPLVLDADAINILSENKTWLSFLPANCVFTPHPGEFKRMVGEWDNDDEKLQLLRDFAIKYKCYVVLKGAHTVTACPDSNLYFNSSGNPGMATAGSGDSLTGIITALIAQGYSPQISCILGVYLHGLAGDIASEEKGEISIIAGDIITALPYAFSMLEGSLP